MRMLKRVLPLVFAALALAGVVRAADAPAAAPAAASPTALGTDRLFRGFIEDAAFVNKQWWEGRLEYADGKDLDVFDARFIVAFQPIRRLEVGGRIAYGGTSGSDEIPTGSGLSDMDLWGKWNFGTFGGSTDVAAGAVITVPTGRHAVALGYDAFGLEAFGAMRHRVQNVVINARAGVQFNQNGQIAGVDISGKTSAILGFGALWAVASQVSLTGEIDVRTERFDGGDSDSRVVVGANIRPSNQGVVRLTAGFGLTDGAPRFEIGAGYAFTF